MNNKLTDIIMKNKFLLGIGLISLAFFGCDESGWDTPGTEKGGYISPLIDLETKMVSTRSEDTRADAESIGVEDLTLSLKDNDNNIKWSGKYSAFPTDRLFSVGKYSLEASYGNKEEEGFEKLALYGKQDLTVSDGKTTDISLKVTPVNSRIIIEYEEAFKKYMTDWKATVNGIDYIKTEERPVYIKPGEVTLKISVTKPSGTSGEFTLDNIKVEAGYQYIIKVNVNEGAVGDATLEVEFDDNMNEENVKIDISDKVLNAPLPIIDTDGFISGNPITVVAGISELEDLSMSIIAQAGLTSVKMTTKSVSLKQQGWPEEVELLNTDASIQSRLTNLGFSGLGIWKTPGEMAYLDFSNVVSHIEYDENADNTTSFTVVAKDKLMRESDPVTLMLNIQPINLNISSNTNTYNPGEDITVNIDFNGSLEDLKKNVEFQYLDGRGIWDPLVVKTYQQSSNGYIVTLTTPSNFEADLKVKAVNGKIESNILTFTLAPFYVEVDERNVFAKHAFVKVLPTDGNSAPDTSNLKFEIKNGDGSYEEVSHENAEQGYFKLKGLSSNTKQKVRVIIDGQTSTPTEFTTEEELPVPNGDFEELNEIFSETINQGGPWSTTSVAEGHNNTATFTILEPNNWSSSNSKTMNGTNKNTWFFIPSVFNSNLEYTSDCPGVLNVGVIKSKTPPSYTGFSTHSNNNSIVIRNVAWDPDGITPEKEYSEGTFWGVKQPDYYYNYTVPEIANICAGKLFLGNYPITEELIKSEGYSFTSRPLKLKGWYTYKVDEDSQQVDNGVISIVISDDDTIITQGEVSLYPKDEMTQFEVILNYNISQPKANRIKIMITSSKYASSSSDYEKQNINVTTYLSKIESFKHGATLVVDDLEFVY